MPRSYLLLSLLCFISALQISASSDSDALLAFKTMITGNGTALRSWTAGSSPCIRNKANWTGVICDAAGAVLGLQLENMSLSGSLNLDALSGVSNLRTLSFMNNSFSGGIPAMSKLGGLRSIYLSINQLSGDIPDGVFTGMGTLRRVHLAMNQFTGPIPSSLTGLQRLVELRLDGNQFDGSIPDFQQQGLQVVNVSGNNLSGQIPDGLAGMNTSLFAGNKDLCGEPLGTTCKTSSKKISTALIVSVVAIILGVILAVTGIFIAVLHRKRDKTNALLHAASPVKPKAAKAEQEEAASWDDENQSSYTQSVSMVSGAKEQEQGRLVFVREDRERFEMQDLLKASAEILTGSGGGGGGGGGLGSSYKAMMVEGPTMVVKRFKEMRRVGKEEFEEHMRRIGRLRHPNLLPVVAYYYRKEEKLLVSDFIPNGSLADLLHGDTDGRNWILDWPARLKIVRGVARGLAHLYEELPTAATPHGHLKSSNILLDAGFEPLLTDYALAPLLTQSHAVQTMVAYKSPECTQTGRPTRKSDVWSLGILILELLTGKFPGNYLRHGRADMDLVRWVNSVVREEWTGEVFDSTMKGTKNAEQYMLKLLQIGLACCERSVEKRWEMREAMEKIEELKDGGGEEEYSSYVSDAGEYCSSRAMTDDEFSFSARN